MDIRAWLSGIEEAGQMPRTRNLKLASLRSFYKYLTEENLLTKDPTLSIKPANLDNELPVYLDKVRLVLLFEKANNNPRDRAIIETLYSTGARVSELLNVKLEDIKSDSQQIWIRKGKGNKERFVLYTTPCGERLKEYLANRTVKSPYLFANARGGPLSRVWVERIFNYYSKELNFKVTPHTLRHTFAAHLAEKGMPQSYIQELLGHVSINTTKIYAKLSAKARKKQYDSYQ